MSYPLVPIVSALRVLFGTSNDLPGLASGLVVRDAAGWRSATDLAGPALGAFLESAERQWNARPAAAAALAWKAYTYWLSVPAVVGLLAARRVPLMSADQVRVRLDWPHRLLTVGLAAGIPVAVLPGDPLAASGDRGVIVVPDEAALVETLRRSLLDEHLTPLADAIGGVVRLNRRMLFGSLAASVAGLALRVTDADPVTQARRIDGLLDALTLSGLVTLVADEHSPLRVRRRTCCLAFTLPRPRICRDCCIRAAD